MSFIFTILMLFSLRLGAPHGVISTQNQQNDQTAKSDMDELAGALEAHYSLNGEYPTEKEVTQHYDISLPGIDPAVLTDQNGKFINQGAYLYKPSDCTAIGCGHFIVSAQLSDKRAYQKTSIR